MALAMFSSLLLLIGMVKQIDENRVVIYGTYLHPYILMGYIALVC